MDGEDPVPDPDPEPVDPVAAKKAKTIKIISIFIFLAEGFGLGVLPVFCKAFSENPRVLGIANAFSGGVFLAIAMMHIMPEQVEGWKEYREDQGKGAEFPAPFLFAISGYTLMLVLDKVLFDAHPLGTEDDHDHINPAGGSFPAVNVEKLSLVEQVRQSITNHSVGASNVEIEKALKKSLTQSVRKSQKFADHLKAARRDIG